MKNTTHDWTEPPDKQHYKKRYLERKLEEKEAEKEIDDYLTNERNPSRLDGLGRKRGEK